MQIMILGMHRSGTSVLARMLNLMGVYFGPEGMSTGANKENPKGFWERRDVRELNDMVLHAAGCDWNRVLEFDIAKVPASVMADFNTRAGRLILDMDAHRPWLLKEPRLCLLLPLWRRFLEVPICVHIVRHPVEVASSLRTRNDMPIEVGLVLWDRYVSDALQASADLPGVMVFHRQLMEDPKAAMSRLLADLQAAEIPNLRMPTEQEIQSFIRADLYRERETRPDLAEYADASQAKFFERLTTGKLPQQRSVRPMSVAARKTLAEYEASLPPLELPKSPPRPMPESERVLRERLALKSQEVQFARELAEKASAETTARDQRVAALDRELALAREAVANRSETIKKRDERIAALDRELALAREAVANQSETIKKRDERVAALDRELAGAQEAANKLSGEIEKSNVENMQLGQTNGSLIAELRATVEARNAVEASVSARFREIELLTRELMDQENVIRKAETRARSLGEKLAKAETRLRGASAKLDETIAGGAAGKSKLLRKIDMQANDLAQAAAQIGSLREERESLRRQTGQLTLRAASQCQRTEALELQLHEMGKSVTWRIGAPMRGVRRLIGRRHAGSAVSVDDVATIRGSELFDAAWYVGHYPDALENSLDPAEHYFDCGAFEGRNPGPHFDTGFYLSRHVDVAESGQNPLVHFIRHGAAENRAIKGRAGR